MKYENLGQLNRNYFSLGKNKIGKYSLQHFINQIDIDNYVIIKISSNFRILTMEEMMLEKYSGYVFIKKDIFDENNFNNWIKYMKINNICFKFFHKPLPSFDPFEKIIELK